MSRSSAPTEPFTDAEDRGSRRDRNIVLVFKAASLTFILGGFVLPSLSQEVRDGLVFSWVDRGEGGLLLFVAGLAREIRGRLSRLC